MKDRYFESNKRDVNAEVIDGEAIMINVATGVYYSLEHIGAAIWELLMSGHSMEQTAQVVVGRYPESAGQARQDLEELVTQLLEEDLLRERASAEQQPLNGAILEFPEEGYVKPTLNVYRDMGDLLALDPPTPGLTITSWDSDAETSK